MRASPFRFLSRTFVLMRISERTSVLRLAPRPGGERWVLPDHFSSTRGRLPLSSRVRMPPARVSLRPAAEGGRWAQSATGSAPTERAPCSASRGACV